MGKTLYITICITRVIFLNQKTISSVVSEEIVEALGLREMMVENYINYLRIFAWLVSSLDDLLLFSVFGETSGFNMSMVIQLTFGSIFLYGIHVLTSDGQYRPWIKYSTITVDFFIFFDFVSDYGNSAFLHRFVTSDGLTALFFSFLILLNFLASLRFSAKAVLYSGVLSILGGIYTAIKVARSTFLISAGLPIIIISIIIALIASESVRKMFIKVMQRKYLARFLPKEVVESIDKGNLLLELGGDEKVVTILIADIRQFTALSENMNPTDLVGLLNVYFSHMAEVIFAHGGTLDKFMGDAILAVFGSPIPHPDDPVRAVQSAIDMHKMVKRVNEIFEKAGKPSLKIGIAVHTGKVVAGNIGSPRRMEFTVIGDAVNVVSRVEELNKVYKTSLLITEDTYKLLQGAFPFEYVGETNIRGRQGLVKLYTLKNIE